MKEPLEPDGGYGHSLKSCRLTIYTTTTKKHLYSLPTQQVLFVM